MRGVVCSVDRQILLDTELNHNNLLKNKCSLYRECIRRQHTRRLNSASRHKTNKKEKNVLHKGFIQKFGKLLTRTRLCKISLIWKHMVLQSSNLHLRFH